MALKVSQLLTPGIRWGHNLKTDSTESALEPGLLAQLTTSGSSVIRSSGSVATGMAYGNRYSVYRPTTRVFAAGEPVTLITGQFMALLSSDFFVGGVLPTTPFPEPLYAAANGLWAVTGTYKVGECDGIVVQTQPTGGTGSTINLALVRANIVP